MKKILFAVLAVAMVAFIGCKPTPCPECGEYPCVCDTTEVTVCPECGQNPCVCPNQKPEIPEVAATDGAVTVVWKNSLHILYPDQRRNKRLPADT